MYTTSFIFLKNILHKLVNTGIYPDMPYVESRYTKLLNVLNLIGIVLALSYACFNSYQERPVLMFLNLWLVIDATVVLLLHKYRKYLSARLVMITSRFCLYTFSGLFFHNGSQYFLWTLIITTLLLIDLKWLRYLLCSLILLSSVSVAMFPQQPIFGAVVMQRQVMVNMIIASLIMLVSVTFFKNIQLGYQREVEKQRQALIQLNKDKEKVFSILAHDIRSPIATLENLLQAFHADLLTGRERIQTLGTLHEQVSCLSTTIDNLLRWSSRSMVGMQPIKTSFYLQPLVLEVLYFFDLLFTQKHLVLDVSVPGDMTIYADRDQTAVILRNLLSNAIKFSKLGGTIRIRAVDAGEMIDIVVMDEGIGMDECKVKMLFSVAQQPTYGTSGEHGYGIGLSLCAEFTRLNRGAIQVNSRPDAGSIFTVSLPKGEI